MHAANGDIDELVGPERDSAAVKEEETVLRVWIEFLNFAAISDDEVLVGSNVFKYALGFYEWAVRSVF